MQRLLITGATGKVGRNFLQAFWQTSRFDQWHVRALCHNRSLPESPRLDVIRGTIVDRQVVRQAMLGVSHVLHLSTCKETPDDVIDVTVKGMFWLLEESPSSIMTPRP